MSKIDWNNAQPIFDVIYKLAKQETESSNKLKPKSPEYNKELEKNMRKFAEAKKAPFIQYGEPTISEYDRLFDIYLKEKLKLSQ